VSCFQTDQARKKSQHQRQGRKEGREEGREGWERKGGKREGRRKGMMKGDFCIKQKNLLGPSFPISVTNTENQLSRRKGFF
jgi:hypothetical protein